MQVRIADRIDRSPIGGFQLRTVFLCGLVALLDGLDVQTMALVVPTLADAWDEPKASFGPVLSSSFAGLMIGALAGGLLGDRFGRRVVLILAFLTVGIASILTASAGSHAELIVWRLFTGLGIGACMPNFTVLTAEYIPAHRQAFFITLLYSAIPVGGIVGGMLAPIVIAAWGWQAVFILSGAIPLAIAAVLFLGLPESPRFLAGKGDRPERLGAILERIDPTYRYAADHVFLVEDTVKGPPLPALFAAGRALHTVLLWLILFCSLAGFYLLTSWLPTLLAREGWSNFDAAQSVSYFFFGGVIGCIIVGWLIDRYGPFHVLTAIFLSNAALIALLGLAPASYATLIAIIAVTGLFLSAAQTGTMVLAARVYPTAIRSTGVGWGLGIGRIGAVLSPLLGGAAIAADWSREAFFLTAALPAIVSAMAVLALGRSVSAAGTRSPSAAQAGA